MFLTLVSVAATLVLALVLHRLFFASGDGKIKTAPFWFLPYRQLIQKKSFADVTKELSNYGPICYVWFGLSKRVMVNDLELARSVFSRIDDYPKCQFFSPKSIIGKFFGNHVVMVNGDEWKKQRKVMNPAFKIQMIKSFTEGFVEKIQAFLDVVDKSLSVAESKNQPLIFEPNDLLQKMTLDVLGKTVFNYDFNYVQSEKEDQFITAYNNIIHQLFSPKFVLAPWLFSLGVFNKMETEMKRFDQLLYDIINVRRKQMAEHPNEEPKDFLGLMLKSVADEELNDQELRDNLFVFFLAGHETTAGALGSAIYALAQYPEEQLKLLEDIKKLKGAVPTYEDTQRFEYIPAFIKEVMRVYPPVASVQTRATAKDEQLGDYTINKNTRVIVNINGIHHTPSLWRDPEQFNPHRFFHKAATEPETEDTVTAWMPFGGGPRACLGNNFSLLEQRLFLSMFLQKFVVESCPDYQHKQPIVGMMKPLDLKVVIKRRIL